MRDIKGPKVTSGAGKYLLKRVVDRRGRLMSYLQSPVRAKGEILYYKGAGVSKTKPKTVDWPGV